jgi:hypothetical protein
MSCSRSLRVSPFVLFLAPLSLIGVTACGENEQPESHAPAATGGAAPANPDDDIVVPPAPGGGNTEACVSDADCAPGACHPVTQTCAQVGGSCAADADCALGFFCNTATGLCLAGLAGSPCTTADNCYGGGSCNGGTCGCAGFVQEQEVSEGKLDVYFMFDHTTSMIGAGMPGGMGMMGGGGDPALDCAFTPGTSPPVVSKACSATYALSNYLIGAPPLPEADTRLALQFMSLSGEDSCEGGPYAQPMIDLTQLPLEPTHPMIQAISDDDFNTANNAANGTQIEGALRGIAQYTAANKAPGREMIGVLMTDGDPNGCNEDIDDLAQIIAEHYAETGIRTFIIGVEGATDANLERLAIEGGAEPHDDFCGSVAPPCHYWNVGDASGDVLAAALQAIVGQSTPIGCEFPLANIQPAAGQMLDPSTINVTLTSPGAGEVTILNTPSQAECPTAQLGWHYDNPVQPTTIHLCPSACDAVKATAGGAQIDIVGGCQPTVSVAK